MTEQEEFKSIHKQAKKLRDDFNIVFRKNREEFNKLFIEFQSLAIRFGDLSKSMDDMLGMIENTSKQFAEL